jgi:hypothetical protein
MIALEGRTPNDQKPRRMISDSQGDGHLRVEIVVPHSGKGPSVSIDAADLLNVLNHADCEIHGTTPEGNDARVRVHIAEVANITIGAIDFDEQGAWTFRDGAYSIRLPIPLWVQSVQQETAQL